jgi:alkylation response protein AidB-like acyl-CoA dehydrogenase
METTDKKTIKGGEFLITETNYQDVFIPEEFDEEQQMIAQTCRDFLVAEVYPNLDRIDTQEEGLMPSLMDKAGALGILGVSIPEEFGGFGKNFNTSMLVADGDRCRALFCCGTFCTYRNRNIADFILWK